MPIPRNPSKQPDWAAIRDAYMQRTPVPTYTELSEEYGVSCAVVARVANDQQWAICRKRAQDAALQAVNAGSVIMEAISADKETVEQLRRSAISTLIAVEQAGQHLLTLMSNPVNLRKGLDMANTASFALSNIANALKTVGVVGIPKALSDAGKMDNGRWDKGLLQQINVTVQSLQQPVVSTTAQRSETTDTEPAERRGGQLAHAQPALDVVDLPAPMPEPAHVAQPDSQDNGQKASV